MTKKKLTDMNHEEAFFYILACSKLYFDYANDGGEEFNPKTARGKKIIHYAEYLHQLEQLSEKQGVPL